MGDRGRIAFFLRAYGWMFLAAGAVFLLFPGPLTRALGWLAEVLPSARPMSGSEPSLWLGLAGSMMAMVAYASFTLARDPAQAAAWDILLLSKGTSTLLFILFALVERNALFLIGSVVDGPIFLHLLYLRLRSDERFGSAAADGWRARSGDESGPGYEVWFVKFNALKSKNALWVRYTLRRTKSGSEASCWYVFFDPKGEKIVSGRWDAPESAGINSADGDLCRIGSSVIRRDGARGEGPDVRWELSWESMGAPAFAFVPEVLYRMGVAGTLYCTPLSMGRFHGKVRVGENVYAISDAVGSVGHLWGRKMGDNWRWGHAVFEDTVFEILSAQGRAAGILTPRWTSAHLWYKGKHYSSAGLCRGFTNSTSVSEKGWTFRVDFGGLTAVGECRPAPELTAELEYTDTNGRKLLCRNSKTGFMRLSLIGKDGELLKEFETRDTAAVETVA